jgi:3-hydroxyisobutyrate dehydrogenase-like beta-hydroxyacid dehydrogenase
MGRSVGRVLREHGATVTTSLVGRSARTAKLAESAGIIAIPDDDALVRGADVILSIVPPGEAVGLAERMAGALKRTGAHPAYVDCNAISAETMGRIAAIIRPTDAPVVDVGIIGPPPGPGVATKLYASGPSDPAVLRLKEFGIDLRWLSENIGDASVLKMSYGGLTKGLTALATLLMISARQAGVDAALTAELADSQAPMLAWLDRQMPRMPPKAYRWVAEMEEGAATLARGGMNPDMLDGAAKLYQWIAGTPLGRETPEDRQLGTSRELMIAQLAEALALPKRG